MTLRPGPRVSRREFVEVATATALATACGSEEPPGAAPASTAPAVWAKDPARFIRHPTNLETRLEDLRGFLTPNELFFVRNHGRTPRVARETYRLRVEGDAVRQPLDLTYDDLLRLPGHSVIAYLECAGNWRSFHQEVYGRAASGEPWGTGAVGCAEWSGVSLGHVLEAAGVEESAVDVNLVGGDEAAVSRPMPLAKAVDPDTLLALTMNGVDLPPDHGFPVRGVVPGWSGSNSIKWLTRIVVTREPQWVKNNTISYVLIGDAWPAERYAPADGKPITELSVKSALALARPARLARGPQRLHGYAHGPHGPVRRVEWRVDGGAWREARIVEPVLPRAWQRFEFEWEATPGPHTLHTRAHDAAGNVQPDAAPFNEKGYLLNVPIAFPVTVT
jgi:DMSO/TMAO reductase YedYZ molybdopterin-dependent catalytic subunit